MIVTLAWPPPSHMVSKPAMGAVSISTGSSPRADRWRIRGDRDHAHVLHAARYHQVSGAAEHRLGGEVHRLLRRAALPVHGDAGHRLGQARRQPGRAGDVTGPRADRVHAAEHDIVDRQRIGLGAGQQDGDERLGHLGPQGLS
jgi:hypothetical protein